MSTWQPVSVVPDSALGGVDWSRVFPSGQAALDHCDPYFVWADIASVSPPGGGPWAPCLSLDGEPAVQVLLELPRSKAARQQLLAAIEATATHRHAARRTILFRPVVLPVAKIPTLVEAVVAGAGAVRFEYMAPRALAAGDPLRLQRFVFDARQDLAKTELTLTVERPDTKAGNPAEVKGLRRVRTFGDRSDAFIEDDDEDVEPEVCKFPSAGQTSAPTRAYVPPREQGPRLCVIDDRFNFTSPRLDRAAIDTVWLQGAPSVRMQEMLEGGFVTEPRSAAPPLGALHGWCVKLGDLRGPPPRFAEAESLVRARLMRSRPHWSHGSALLDVLASRGLGQGQAKPPFVHLVQLAASTVVDTTGGALSGHALEGIHDALQQAKLRRVDRSGGVPTAVVPAVLPQHPLVVNLSYGHHGGPHDGTSMFERAAQELLNVYRNLHLVVSAGNAHLLRAHAKASIRKGRRARLRLKVCPDNPADTFVELWADAADALEISVTPPGGSPIVLLEPSGARTSQWSDGDVLHAALVYPRCVAQSTKGTMALLAIAPTRRMAQRFSGAQYEDHVVPARRQAWAPHGVWTITLHNTAGRSCKVHAYVQRGDAAPGRERAVRGETSRQAYFLDKAGPTQVSPVPDGTLNGIGTLVDANEHGRYHVVGAMRRDDRGVSEYSAAGPTRATSPADRPHGPDAVVPGDESLLRPGLRTTGMLGASRVRVGGTSMAAALFARSLFDSLVSGQPPPSQQPAPPGPPPRRPTRTPEKAERAANSGRGEARRIAKAAWDSYLDRQGRGLP